MIPASNNMRDRIREQAARLRIDFTTCYGLEIGGSLEVSASLQPLRTGDGRVVRQVLLRERDFLALLEQANRGRR